jgi:hypothetical protein
MARAGPESQTTLQVKPRFETPAKESFELGPKPRRPANGFSLRPTTPLKSRCSSFAFWSNYQVVMHHANGRVHRFGGRYREIRPREKLLFTWRSDPETGDSETLVTVEFHDLGGSTEIVLIHERFSTLEEREKHSHGRTGGRDQLAKILTECLQSFPRQSRNARKLLFSRRK